MEATPGFAGRRLLLIGMVSGTGLTVVAGLAIAGFRWWWCSLFGVGVAIGLELAVRPGRPLDHLRLARGVEAEAHVASLLRDIERFGFGWVDHVDLGLGDVDAVVVGPTGVFALETKNWPGIVRSRQDGGGLERDGHDARAGTRQAIGNAIRIREALAVRWVEAVLVCVNADVASEPIELGSCTVVSANGLKPFLINRPVRLSEDEISSLLRRLRELSGRTGVSGSHTMRAVGRR